MTDPPATSLLLASVALVAVYYWSVTCNTTDKYTFISSDHQAETRAFVHI